MATIDDLYQAFGKLNIREQIPAIIQRNEYPLIVKVISQRDRGIGGDSQKITPAYASKYYTKFKTALNPTAGGNPDGKVTGNYNSEMHVTTAPDIYTIDSTIDYATSASLTQYGNNFNLPTEQSREEYWQETLVPEIIDTIKKETGL